MQNRTGKLARLALLLTAACGATPTNRPPEHAPAPHAETSADASANPHREPAAPPAVPERPNGEPGRTSREIQALVQAHRDEVRACYDAALHDHPDLAGDLEVKWVIDPDGNVTDAVVNTAASTVLEPSVGKCVIEVLSRLKFAASKKRLETRVRFPFNFQPHRSGSRGSGNHP